MAHWAISGRRVWASPSLLCPFPSVSHLLNHSHAFPHFPSDQRHHWKSGFLTNRLCPARICRLYIFIGQSLPCLEEVVRLKRFIYGVIYEFTKWQSDEGAVFTLVPFYMEITNLLFLFKSGTRTIQVKSARNPRWHMTPLFFWSDQGLSRVSRDSTPQLSVVKPHVGMCVVKSQLPFHPRDSVHFNSQFSVEGQWVSCPRGSFLWLHFWACRMAPCKLSPLNSRTLWNQFIMLWAENDWE